MILVALVFVVAVDFFSDVLEEGEARGSDFVVPALFTTELQYMVFN